MNNDKDYLSEFEREFELNDFSSEYGGETNVSEEFEEDEFENDFSNESDDEFENQDEYELNDEYESNDEYEFQDEQSDSEFENYLQESNSPDQEFEDRIYSALSGEYESSFEMEQEIDRVLHEMEVEYFWKSAKKFWNKHKKKLMPLAKNLIPGGTLASLAKFAGGDVRGLLKKGLTMAANTYLPGVGGVIAGKLLNNETPVNDARAQAAQLVQVAKNTYQNTARLIPNLRPGNIPQQISRLSQQGLRMAKAQHRNSRSYKGKNKKVIRINANSVVVVKPDRVIIYS